MGNLIKVNATWSFEKDLYGWKLHNSHPAVKHGKPTGGIATTTTYPVSLKHIAKIIIEHSVGDCETMEQVIEMLEDAKRGIVRTLKSKYEEEETEDEY